MLRSLEEKRSSYILKNINTYLFLSCLNIQGRSGRGR